MNNKTAAGLVLVCLLMISAILPAFAGNNADVYTSVTTGKRKVVNSDIQKAKNKAESDALEIALQNAFSSLLPGQVLAANLDFLYDKILPAAKDYIITYKVLGGIQDRGHYLVGVESKVDLRRLEKQLTRARILNAKKNRPVVLFFISEQTSTDELPRIWWGSSPDPYRSLTEQMVADQMVKEGFMIIGSSSQRPDPSFYNIVFQSDMDTTAAIHLGRQMKADMIVFGSAVSSEAMNRMGEDRTFNAVIQLDGYNVATGERTVVSRVDAVVSSQTDIEGNSSAIAKAADLSARDLIDKIDEYWNEYLRKEHSFAVRIEGDQFHPRYLALTQRFRQMPGIENMQPKEMGTNYAILEMFYKGKADQFANALMLKTFDNFGFEFLEVSGDLVSIQLIEKTKKPASDEAEDTDGTVKETRLSE